MESINGKFIIPRESETELSDNKLKSARFAWWAVFLMNGLFFGFYWQYVSELEGTFIVIYNWVYRITSFFSIALALFLYYKKPKNWMALLVSMMLVSLITNYRFSIFYSILDSAFLYTWGFTNRNAIIFAEFMSFLTLFIRYSLIFTAFLHFPNGKWVYRRVWWILIVWVIAFVIESFYSPFVQSASFVSSSNMLFSVTFFMILVGVVQIRNYYQIQDAIQHQQIKWVLIFWSGLALLSITGSAVEISREVITDEVYLLLVKIFSVTRNVLVFGMVASFAISIVRYRLWDVDIFFNRAVVYSVLTGLLGVLGGISLAVINYAIGQWFEENSSVWAVVISVLPVAAAFNPLRDWVQEIVDRYFKPEEVNFENHFLEFRSDIRDMLGTSRMIEVVSRQVKKQLDVETVRIYLADENENIPSLAVGDDALKRLINGQLVVGEDNSEYSLMVPLVVERPVIPDFIGVIVLGRRLKGKGYSTPILDSLTLLGTKAGEAIYLSRLNEQFKIKVMA
ncbi:MAG: hypothetical protein IPL71_24170 [Anaerolineales bacterium]|uniref:hypothetical protein n=1 Tax=Candidatus Villigracilis proximus TaxID=3140683 RepID=UPI0031374B19|nr:hypothetical protein [Anaerolineales bacterium]